MTTFGRYQLLRRLGAGGMGEVFLARLSDEADPSKLLVVKRIHPAWQRDPAFIEMFLDEARIAARLNHPNIVQIFELGMVEGVHFLAMEYVEGVSLAKLSAASLERQKPVPMGAVCRTGADAAAALAHAHRAFDTVGASLRLVHRDVSPQNILVGLDGRVKLIDFGIAKATGRLKESQPGALRGKSAYASPEQVRGAELDERSDVFALGIVLWELCTGARLFRGDSEAATLKNVTACIVPPPSALAPGVPKALEELLLRALAKEPEARFQDALALRDALEAIAAERGPEGTPAGLEAFVRELFADEISTRSGPLAVDAEPLTGPTRPQASGEPTGPDLSNGAGSPRNASADFAAAARRRVGAVTRPSGAPGEDDTNVEQVPGLFSPRTSFVGRAEELAALAGLFASGARVVTVVGPGGAGKTRLALEYTRQRRDGPAWVCDLTCARTAAGLCGAVAGALGLQLSPTERDLPERVGQALASRGRALLVLDHFEPVAAHAAATIGRWLGLAPQTSFLVTSRERLSLPGEEGVELSALPPADAGKLFWDRALAALPSFKATDADAAAVGALVLALGGLPLAIELAAARLKTLALEELSARLSRQLERHEPAASLRAALEWTVGLLDPVERAAFAECSVFHGGFSLEAAEAVLAPETGGPPVVDTLNALREKALLRTYEPPGGEGLLRFGPHPSVSEYAAEVLAGSGQKAPCEERHWRSYLALATQLGEAVEGKSGERALRQLMAEAENLLAAHERAMLSTPPMFNVALGLLVAIEPLVAIRGPASFFGALLDRTLSQVHTGKVPGPLYARALGALGASLRLRKRPDEARKVLEQALALARDTGAGLEARALCALGTHHLHVGQLADSGAAFTRAAELARQAGDALGEARALSGRGAAQLQANLFEAAETDLREALTLFNRARGRYGEAVASGSLGALKSALGQHAEARAHLGRALGLSREFEARELEAFALVELSSLGPDQGRPEEGLADALEALAVARRFGVRHVQGSCLQQLAAVLHECGRLVEACTAYEEAAALLDDAGDRRRGALARALWSAAEAAQGRVEPAMRLLEAAKLKAAASADAALQAVLTLGQVHLEAARARAAEAAGDGEKAAAMKASARARLVAPAPVRSSAVRLALRLANRAAGV
jgi:serine/threonine protein kinase/predicted ATPase